MKNIVPNLLFLVAILSGCATDQRDFNPRQSGRVLSMIDTLYRETRHVENEAAQIRFTLIPDVEVVNAAEVLLLHYSRSDDATIRTAAAIHLAHFGTKPALTHALELARDDPTPEVRAEIWSAIAYLIHKKMSFGATKTQSHRNSVGILTNADYPINISSLFNPSSDIIIPVDITREELEDALIVQYASDDGEWSYDVVDKIPYVPFTKRKYPVRLSVRMAIANTLEWSGQGNIRILAAFKEFSLSQDPVVREPAMKVVIALSGEMAPPSMIRDPLKK